MSRLIGALTERLGHIAIALLAWVEAPAACTQR
jgi:hypothetical protein